MKNAVIFGAGKIARGFVAQLLHLSAYALTFVDIDQDLIASLRHEKSYIVHILGDERLNSCIDHYRVINLLDRIGIANVLAEADLVFTAVGGKNLESVGSVIAKAWDNIDQYPEHLNFITCENWKSAGEVLYKAIEENVENKETWRLHGAVSEGVVMRIATQPSAEQLEQEPLGVWVQNFWELPINQDTFKGELDVQGMKLIPHFGRFLEQKLYTNNTSNAFIAYYGYQLGYRIVAEAANAEIMQPMLDALYDEINAIMMATLDADEQAQKELSQKAREKYSDWKIVDQLTRHGHDPLRKLGPEDRLIAPARMALRHGIEPWMIVKAIAVALYFDDPNDEGAVQLQVMRKTKGIAFVLKEVCKLSETEPLTAMILQEVEALQKAGVLHA